MLSRGKGYLESMFILLPLEIGITKIGTMIFTHVTGNETLSKNVKLCLFDIRRFTVSLFFILLSLLYVKITLVQADPKKKLTRSLVSKALESASEVTRSCPTLRHLGSSNKTINNQKWRRHRRPSREEWTAERRSIHTVEWWDLVAQSRLTLL